jgi:hypothetical protein
MSRQVSAVPPALAEGSNWLQRALIETAKMASLTTGTYLAPQLRHFAGRRGGNTYDTRWRKASMSSSNGHSVHVHGNGEQADESNVRQRDLLRIVLVPGLAYDAPAEEALLARVAQRVGPMRVVVQKVPAVPRTANGKLQAVVSLVARPSERE